LVDSDPQANATSGLGFDFNKLPGGLYEALTQNLPIANLIQTTSQGGLRLLPSSPNLAGASVELLQLENREFRLKKIIEPLIPTLDYILIDCPPSLGILTVNALVASRYVLIPVQCEYYALEGLSQLLGTLELVRHNLQPNLDVLGAVLTMREKRTRLSRGVVKEMTKNFPGRVFETIIPRNVRLSEAPSFGKTILEYDHRSQGGKAYKRLAQELLAVLEE